MRTVLLIATLTLATPLGAHPHIFVDVGLRAITNDDGQLTHVEVTWAYDALYSLLITEDRGLDLDGDAVLTPEEEAELTGFDMQWVEGFNGDLVARLDGDTLTLGRPQGATASMREGRIVTTHLRAVEDTRALAGTLLTLKPYDATFYTAYDVTMGVSVDGLDGCMITKQEPDLDREMERLQNQLAALSADQDAIEMGFPEVGEAFATEVQITCAAF